MVCAPWFRLSLENLQHFSSASGFIPSLCSLWVLTPPLLESTTREPQAVSVTGCRMSLPISTGDIRSTTCWRYRWRTVLTRQRCLQILLHFGKQEADERVEPSVPEIGRRAPFLRAFSQVAPDAFPPAIDVFPVLWLPDRWVRLQRPKIERVPHNFFIEFLERCGMNYLP